MGKDLDIGVNALLFNADGEILLGKRRNCLGDGLYSLIGGHLKEGETVEDGIIRELKEELGVTVLREDVEVVNFAYVRNEGAPMIEIGVLIKRYDGEIDNREPQRCESLGYFRLDELPEMFAATKPNLDLYISKKFYDRAIND
ncbi:MAG: NUDIX domain-containing protein [Clostridia bacterium]|nr:NUDIX domain-containing protein [Clostridia bacterium]